MIKKKSYASITGALQKIKTDLDTHIESMQQKEIILNEKKNNLIKEIDNTLKEQNMSKSTSAKLTDLLGI